MAGVVGGVIFVALFLGVLGFFGSEVQKNSKSVIDTVFAIIVIGVIIAVVIAVIS